MAVEQRGAVRAFDHAVVPVMDLWRAERFYTNVLGGGIFQKLGMVFRPPDVHEAFERPVGAFVKLGRSHVGLFLEQHTPVHPPAVLGQGYPCLGLAVAEASFPAVIARVRETGVPVTPEHAMRYGTIELRGVRCTDTEGNCLELVADPLAAPNGQPTVGLSHMRVEAVDLAATAEFYTSLLGLQRVDEGPDWVALQVADRQLWIIQQVTALSPATAGPYYGRHFAFHVDDEAFHAIVERLHRAGVEEGDALARHVPGELATYLYDPNGLWLQLLNHTSTQFATGRERWRYAAV